MQDGGGVRERCSSVDRDIGQIEADRGRSCETDVRFGHLAISGYTNVRVPGSTSAASGGRAEETARRF